MTSGKWFIISQVRRRFGTTVQTNKKVQTSIMKSFVAIISLALVASSMVSELSLIV